MTGPDAASRAALEMPRDRIGKGSPVRLRVLPDNEALVQDFAGALLDAYRDGLAAGRERVVLIVPVGPVGQFEVLAERCAREGIALDRLVLINMDEYLTEDGDFIPAGDPLSFRGHMERALWSRLPAALAPPQEARIFPDPRDPDAVGRAIARWGGVDVCFGGVGITGHLAFNDPPEPGEATDTDAFAALPTRVVTLSRETLTVNAITASRGNIARIPRRAVTVGMAEILAARRVRIYMNRPWQAAMLRRLLHGPVTEAVPASLLQRHRDAAVAVTEEVLLPPEPQLR